MTSLSEHLKNATPEIPDFIAAFLEKIQRVRQEGPTPSEREKIRLLKQSLKREGDREQARARRTLQIIKEKTGRRMLWRRGSIQRARRAQRTPQSHKTDSGPGSDPDPEPPIRGAMPPRQPYIYSLATGGAQ